MALLLDISVSLDGFVAGPEPSMEEPLGKGGEQLHDWVVGLRAFKRIHGTEGGETGLDNDLVEELWARNGATVMGRRMFRGGSGPWELDPNSNGWWGDEPPFHHPVFVLTHHQREPLELKGTTFTFVTDGPESALAQAREAASDKDVAIGGGADVAQQYLRAGEVDEVTLHVAPVFLGGGRLLFDGVPPGTVELVRTVQGPIAAHLQYRTAK